jgi:hypothetical protein
MSFKLITKCFSAIVNYAMLASLSSSYPLPIAEKPNLESAECTLFAKNTNL